MVLNHRDDHISCEKCRKKQGFLPLLYFSIMNSAGNGKGLIEDDNFVLLLSTLPLPEFFMYVSRYIFDMFCLTYSCC